MQRNSTRDTAPKALPHATRGYSAVASAVNNQQSSGDVRDANLVPESIAIFAVAEKQIAHFKARLIFRMNTPTVEKSDLRLVLPSANLVVYYLQASMGDTSIFRVGAQIETADSLIFSFGLQSVRSSVQFIIRGSFHYLENPTVGLVSLVFPSLIERYQSSAVNVFGGNLGHRNSDEILGREMRLDVQCLLTLPAPSIRSVGCSVRCVSPDGCRVFLRNQGSKNIWSSVEFSVLYGNKNTQCADVILNHPTKGTIL